MRRVANNPILSEFLDNLHYRCARLWSASLREVVPDEDIIDQFSRICTELEQRDAARARDLMERHVQYFIDKIKTQLF